MAAIRGFCLTKINKIAVVFSSFDSSSISTRSVHKYFIINKNYNNYYYTFEYVEDIDTELYGVTFLLLNM